MSLARLRSLFFPALLASVLVQAAAYYLEFGMGLVPCPLCYSQRLFLGAFALVCLCAVVHSPGRLGTRIYAALALFFATGGALLAARHVWLQGNPALSSIECEPAFDYVLESMPMLQVVKAMIIGSPDCVPITWSFLDLTIPEWSLLSFVLLATLPTCRLLGRTRPLFSRSVKN
ncbi:disulfide bond formation protein B [Pseudomonas sp. NPDC087612]|uniref:disulfide bond formation protein B n=1 Tax=Pseudomonas TaxID=286 RepID=UPI0005EBDF7F|nr:MULTISPECIES: disulfide bond formation protein B [unclassified Pseudomonas]KJK15187.1 acetyltransferase [Pseudomonas sp. 2(2015)]QPG64335.1 disulfide bond formation protein B [Pseudomonas sp. BIGb0427]QVM96918.1 disulfide bond formation protein B [Pseudomonas sp. SORT22]UVL56214.1 disulfide bond formation protein B [Pseudomonas sp. B21-035]UVL61513.1 disulfide bond formation protein B [Pseudomonas sp. B21-032]